MVQVKPQTLYLEEDGTMNAEFPEEGKFHLSLLPGNRYKVCGDPEEVQGSEPTPSSSGSMLHCPSSSMLPGPSTHSRGWSIPPPWMSAAGHSGHSANPPKGKNLQSRNYEPFLKQSFQFVTLSLDHTGKNITTQSTNENVYVKIPESSVLVPAILSEIALKVSIPSEDLVILDLKYIHVTDDKGQYACKVQYCDYGYYVSLPFPLQTWSIGKHLAGACMWQNEMNMMNFENKKPKID